MQCFFLCVSPQGFLCVPAADPFLCLRDISPFLESLENGLWHQHGNPHAGTSMNQLTKHITSNIQEQDCGWLKKPVLKEVQSHSYSFTANASSKIFNKKQQDLIRGTRSLRAHAPKPNSSRKWGGGGAYSLEVQRLQKMAGANSSMTQKFAPRIRPHG